MLYRAFRLLFCAREELPHCLIAIFLDLATGKVAQTFLSASDYGQLNPASESARLGEVLVFDGLTG
jgi:hypothetical protein